MYNKYVIYYTYMYISWNFVYFVLPRAPSIESSIFKVTLAPDYLYILHYIVTFTITLGERSTTVQRHNKLAILFLISRITSLIRCIPLEKDLHA